MSDEWIRASEISNFVYCQRAWWLQRVGHVAPVNVRELQTGTQFHQQHGRLVTRSLWARRLAYTLLFFVMAFIAYRIVMGV
jgi:hypothetical protein